MPGGEDRVHPAIDTDDQAKAALDELLETLASEKATLNLRAQHGDEPPALTPEEAARAFLEYTYGEVKDLTKHFLTVVAESNRSMEVSRLTRTAGSRLRRQDPSTSRTGSSAQRDHAPKNSTNRRLISSLRFSSSSASTVRSFRSPSFGLSVGYFTSG